MIAMHSVVKYDMDLLLTGEFVLWLICYKMWFTPGEASFNLQSSEVFLFLLQEPHTEPRVSDDLLCLTFTQSQSQLRICTTINANESSSHKLI